MSTVVEIKVALEWATENYTYYKNDDKACLGSVREARELYENALYQHAKLCEDLIVRSS